MLLKNRQRPIRICIVNQEPRVVDRYLASIEVELKKITPYELVFADSISDEKIRPCDLLVAIAHLLDSKELATWVQSMPLRMEKNNSVHVPALIVCENPEGAAQSLMTYAADQNWYFDLLDTAHLSSLPLRVANLLRIHDHIHELSRYEKAIQTLENKVKELETKLTP